MKTRSKPVWTLGAMSGTSLDGVDAALVLTDGVTVLEFGRSGYRAYAPAEREVIRAALNLWDGPRVTAAAEVVETAHAELLSQFPEAEVVGFHGQTIAHEPRGRGTLQIGDGRVLAEILNRPVVWDFRSADVQMGGQGAPLAPFYHHALARRLRAGGPVAFLNLGGVGNITYADPRIENPAASGACLAFDTGPANAPLNDLMRDRLGLALDQGGALAATGTPDAAILDRLAQHGYFAKMPPKSLDRNDFAGLGAQVAGLSDADAAATLTAAIAVSVARGMEHLPQLPGRMLVTGGGRLNQTLMRMLAAGCDCPVVPIEAVDLDGDMLEAQAFAFLAQRVLRGLPTSGPGTTGVGAAICGGTVSQQGDSSAKAN